MLCKSSLKFRKFQKNSKNCNYIKGCSARRVIRAGIRLTVHRVLPWGMRLLCVLCSNGTAQKLAEQSLRLLLVRNDKSSRMLWRELWVIGLSAEENTPATTTEIPTLPTVLISRVGVRFCVTFRVGETSCTASYSHIASHCPHAGSKIFAL